MRGRCFGAMCFVGGALTLAVATTAAVARADDAPPPAGSESTPAEPPPAEPPASPPLLPRGDHPAPLQVDYAQYGLAIGGDFDIESGGICPSNEITPCIIGSGGGLTLRGGYRPSGPWFVGGAYQFSKLDSNNLFRLGVLQQIRAEMRYYFDFGSLFAPYIEAGLGPCIYGNLFGADTGGAALRAGGGVSFEMSRFAVVGLALVYQPVLLVGYTDTTNQKRDTGVTQFLHLEVAIELRTEVGRE